ncbi:MAG TPA: hypothetical protein VFX16_00080 [Pseudonocardiaceae bacterium]|nr:hypothetical protein [Pseudonocardiaceae bacterium]
MTVVARRAGFIVVATAGLTVLLTAVRDSGGGDAGRAGRPPVDAVVADTR